MDRLVLLVDAKFNFYRNYHIAIKDGLSPFYMACKSIRNLEREFNAKKVILVWDGKSFRRKKSSTYKAHRKKLNLDMLPDVKAFLANFYESYEAVKCEGDDVLASLSLRQPCIIITSDRDLNQCLSKTCKVYNPIKKSYATEDPRYVLMDKLVHGDKSDNVKGVRSDHWQSYSMFPTRKEVKTTPKELLKNLEILSLSPGKWKTLKAKDPVKLIEKYNCKSFVYTFNMEEWSQKSSKH